jgi:hypothetical protein
MDGTIPKNKIFPFSWDKSTDFMVSLSTSSTEGMVMPIEIALPIKLVEFPLRVTDLPGSEYSVTVGGQDVAHAVKGKINATRSLKVFFILFLRL